MAVDYLSFHWETYAVYSVTHYGISGRNLLQLNWGCAPVSERVRFKNPPRVVMLSSLGSKFVNLPLLSRLSELYPIDVYGGPPPDPSLGLVTFWAGRRPRCCMTTRSGSSRARRTICAARVFGQEHGLHR